MLVGISIIGAIISALAGEWLACLTFILLIPIAAVAS